MRNLHITAEKLREITSYDGGTGNLIWTVCLNNKAPIGAKVGNRMPVGYRQTRIFGNRYYVHRLVWLYMTGEWPKYQIDHIDCDKSNNRFENLREATTAENGQNRKKPLVRNEIGLLGVSRNGRFGYRAVIKIGYAPKHLGTFRTPEEAHAAYIAAKREMHPFGTL
jgi:hypothetical protein